jgi:hypothetical protein
MLPSGASIAPSWCSQAAAAQATIAAQNPVGLTQTQLLEIFAKKASGFEQNAAQCHSLRRIPFLETGVIFK